jgi:hypothetical protein
MDFLIIFKILILATASGGLCNLLRGQLQYLGLTLIQWVKFNSYDTIRDQECDILKPDEDENQLNTK